MFSKWGNDSTKKIRCKFRFTVFFYSFTYALFHLWGANCYFASCAFKFEPANKRVDIEESFCASDVKWIRKQFKYTLNFLNMNVVRLVFFLFLGTSPVQSTLISMEGRSQVGYMEGAALETVTIIR